MVSVQTQKAVAIKQRQLCHIKHCMLELYMLLNLLALQLCACDNRKRYRTGRKNFDGAMFGVKWDDGLWWITCYSSENTNMRPFYFSAVFLRVIRWDMSLGSFVVCLVSMQQRLQLLFLKKKKKEEIAQTLYCSQYVPFFHLFIEGNMTEGLFCQENCR